MILFHNHNTAIKLCNRRAIKRWISAVLNNYERIPADINIIFCDSQYLLEMNKKFLNHDYYTDVITFPYSEPDNKEISGDIFIDVETVKSNAVKFKQSFEDEKLRVIIHGILHLAGENDITKEQKEKMRKAEDRALQILARTQNNEISL
ncbi:MAG TPA: rRNA maturation RNase YbeY [Bacteroidales bacterium]|nr:rRNA maturation RNase YbeY [Bacteroidales bacterium]